MKPELKRNLWAIGGGLFFLGYQWAMGRVLMSGRGISPTSDSFFYIFRIGRVMDGHWVNDSSILYTYGMAAIGRLLSLSPMDTFETARWFGPVLIALMLWKLFRALKFSPELTGLAYFFLAFYCNIGPHTFLHFVPSTLAAVLALWWLSFAAQEKPSVFFAGFLVNALLLLAHTSGIYAVVLNSVLLFLCGLRRRAPALIKPALLGIATVIAGYFILRSLPFEPLAEQVKVTRWIKPQSIEAFTSSGGTAYGFAPTSLLMGEAKLAPFDLWIARLKANFFIFLFPFRWAWLCVLPFFAALVANSLRQSDSRLRSPLLAAYFGVYFFLFLSMSYWHERGARLIEFAFPVAFVFLAILLYDLQSKALRGILTVCAGLYLGFLSYNFCVTQNLDHKLLQPLSEEVRQKFDRTLFFFDENLTASYSLANGHWRISSFYAFPYFRPTNDHYFSAQVANCDGPEPDFWVRRLFRRISPRQPNPNLPPPVLEISDELKFDAVEGLPCFHLKKIQYPAGTRLYEIDWESEG